MVVSDRDYGYCHAVALVMPRICTVDYPILMSDPFHLLTRWQGIVATTADVFQRI